MRLGWSNDRLKLEGSSSNTAYRAVAENGERLCEKCYWPRGINMANRMSSGWSGFFQLPLLPACGKLFPAHFQTLTDLAVKQPLGLLRGELTDSIFSFLYIHDHFQWESFLISALIKFLLTDSGLRAHIPNQRLTERAFGQSTVTFLKPASVCFTHC